MNRSHIPYDELIAYAAGDVDIGKSVHIQKHIDTCDQCAATVRRFQVVQMTVMEARFYSPPPQAVTRAKSVLIRHTPRYVSRKPSVYQSLLGFFRRSLVLVATVIALIVLLPFLADGTRTALAASEEALPGDTLYPVKTVAENLQLTFATNDASRAELQLNFVRRRLDELTRLSEQARYSEMPSASQAYQAQLQQAIAIIERLAATDPSLAVTLADKANTEIARHIEVLTALLAKVPDSAKKGIATALQASDKSIETTRQHGSNRDGKPQPPSGQQETKTPGKPGNAGPDKTPDKPDPKKTPEPKDTPEPKKTPDKPEPDKTPGKPDKPPDPPKSDQSGNDKEPPGKPPK